jgi:hypothetical protein
MDLQLQCKFLLDLMAGMLGCGYINSGLLRSSALSEAIESKYGHREKPPSTKKKKTLCGFLSPPKSQSVTLLQVTRRRRTWMEPPVK